MIRSTPIVTTLIFSLAIMFLYFKEATVFRQFPDSEPDFVSYYSAALCLDKGEDFYDPVAIKSNTDGEARVRPYTETPVTAEVFTLFTSMDTYDAKVLWSFISCVMLAGIVVLSVKYFAGFDRLRIDKENILIWVVFMGTVGILRAKDNFLSGQTNIAAGLILALSMAFRKERKDILSGALFACALSVKLTPLLFLLFMINRRNVLKFTLGFAGGLATVILISSATGGFGLWSNFLMNVHFPVYGRSLPGFLSPSEDVNLSAGGVFARIFGEDLILTRTVSYIFAASVICALRYMHFKARTECSKHLMLFPALLASLICFPIFYRHEMIIAYPALVVWINYYLRMKDANPNTRAVIVFVIATGIFIPTLPWTLVYEAFLPPAPEMIFLHSMPFVFFTAVVVGTAFTALKNDK